MARPYVKSRPVPDKPATEDEREELQSGTKDLVNLLKEEGDVILSGDEAGVLRWNVEVRL